MLHTFLKGNPCAANGTVRFEDLGMIAVADIHDMGYRFTSVHPRIHTYIVIESRRSMCKRGIYNGITSPNDVQVKFLLAHTYPLFVLHVLFQNTIDYFSVFLRITDG